MVVSIRANRKRILAFILLAAVVVGAFILLKGGGTEKEPEKEFSGGTNEERVAFLESFGWKVDTEPTETREVMIPSEFNDVYTTYNVMQKAQGFDLKPYAGAVCTQYKYHITNYPGETEVYATLLVQGDVILGGDVACSEVGGFMHGFAKDSARYGEASGKDKAGANKEKKGDSASSGGDKPESGSAEADNTKTGEDASAAETAEESSEEEVEETMAEDVYPTD